VPPPGTFLGSALQWAITFICLLCIACARLSRLRIDRLEISQASRKFKSPVLTWRLEALDESRKNIPIRANDVLANNATLQNVAELPAELTARLWNKPCTRAAIGGSQCQRSLGGRNRDDAWRDVLRGTTHGDNAPYKASPRSPHCRIIGIGARGSAGSIPSVLTSSRWLFIPLLLGDARAPRCPPPRPSTYHPVAGIFFPPRPFFAVPYLLSPSTYPHFFHRRTRPILLFPSFSPPPLLSLSLSLSLPPSLSLSRGAVSSLSHPRDDASSSETCSRAAENYKLSY